tara:strand:- start:26 stop:313 length:288 start_codon:yes stop_codon:yes gene_type:complete
LQRPGISPAFVVSGPRFKENTRMVQKIDESIFTLKSTAPKSKADVTDAVVREYLKEEHEARTALTSKLRAARLALEASQPAPEPVKRRSPRRAKS